MAKKTIDQYFSDLSGIEIDSESSGLAFAFDGTSYEIDLSTEERSKLEDFLEPYVEAGRKVPSRRSSARTSTTRCDPKAVRAWAVDNNIEVPARGRVPAAVVDAYNAAH